MKRDPVGFDGPAKSQALSFDPQEGRLITSVDSYESR